MKRRLIGDLADGNKAYWQKRQLYDYVKEEKVEDKEKKEIVFGELDGPEVSRFKRYLT